MRTHYIDIGDDEWGVLLCHDFDILDSDYMAAIMDTFGMSDDNIREALQVLLGTNTGMTVSRSDICMSAMFIGRATSREQYADTIAHEIDHVQSAVCDYYGIHQGSEVAAYLQGYLMRRIVEALEQ